MNLSIRRQTFNGIASWGIFRGETFVAYALTRLGAERAKNELKSVITTQPKRITQADIDRGPNSEPLTPMRRVYWRARRQVG